MCRPSAHTENSRRTREKPLVPRVVDPSPVDNNNTSKVPSKKISEEQPHSASQESEEAVVDKRTASVQKNSCVSGTERTTASKSRQLTILHFNDVYNIEPRDKEPVGGAARFATKVASLRYLNPLIVFSGDCLNPSTSEYGLLTNFHA